MDIYPLLYKSIPNLKQFIPEVKDFVEYKKLWRPMKAGVTSYKISQMPSDIVKAELAYYIENVTNLKYGFTKNQLRVSVL